MKMPFGKHKGKDMDELPATYLVLCRKHFPMFDHIKHYLNNLWLWKCGMKEKQLNGKIDGNLLHIFKSNWSPSFERFMKNRLAMGYYRYGPLCRQEKGKYKNIESIKKRLKLYEQTGNDEILVDVANLCMVEFINGNHPNKHFTSIDDGIHSEES